MQLFIMRHGHASPYGLSDDERELTEQGKLEVLSMAKYLQGKNVCFDQVLVSPFKRAQQTAKILANTSERSFPIKTVDFITPSGSPSNVHDYIDGLTLGTQGEKINQLLIVSHMPLVSYLVAELTGGLQSPIFQTAGIAEIIYDVKLMTGQLTSLISPGGHVS
ncbi:MAG: phosphohistidine phosphatase SixA [Alteromonadaceae bacterium]|nr:phosphohistidine phosphatase SixA [Alteromonadaceae bacterium]